MANWNCSIELSKEAREELWWWFGNIEEVSGFTIKSSPTVSLLHFNHVFHGDALGTGMFLGMLRNNLVTLESEPFSKEEAAKSSTFLEVKVFWHFYMKTDLTPFKKASILQYTDSKVAEHILTYGSKIQKYRSLYSTLL